MNIEKILTSVIPSEDMRNHLINGGLERSCRDIEEIIFSSPISIEEKYELLKEIEADVHEDVKYKVLTSDDDKTVEWKEWRHNTRVEEFEEFLTTLRIAIELKQKEGVFAIESCDYNSDLVEIDKDFENVCCTFEDVVDWIKEDIHVEEYTPEDTHWHEVSLWAKNDAKKFEYICSYEFINGIACYAYLEGDFAKKHGVNSLLCSKELNLEVPFEAGDIIEVNAVPYAPKYRALVLHIDDNRDCCAVQVLTRNNNGCWEVGGLKHNQVALELWEAFSPLYTASYYKGELPEDEAYLTRVSEYINKDEAKGREVWHYFWGSDKTLEDFVNEHNG